MKKLSSLVLVALSVSSFSTKASAQAVHPGKTTVWAFSDPHVGTDLNQTGYRSLETALRQTFGRWDVAVGAGDWFGRQGCPEEELAQGVLDQWIESPNLLYPVIGNHDNGLDEADLFQRYLDPLGDNTGVSGVDNNLRPYPTKGEWDGYSWGFGNVLFLMLGDNNFGKKPWARGTCQEAGPAGRVRKATYNWWVRKVEANPDKIIVTVAHHALEDTTVWTGKGEAWAAGIHSAGNWFDRDGASFLFGIEDTATDGRTSEDDRTVKEVEHFASYLEENPGAISLWLHGHTHRGLYPGIRVNARGDVEEKWGVTFVNLGALTTSHAEPEVPFSRLIQFTDGSRHITIVPFLHAGWRGIPAGPWIGGGVVLDVGAAVSL